jgi:hypothetical protein
MRHALPVLGAEAATLTPRLPHAPEGRQRARLHMRDRLARGQAHTRREVARLLGVQRHPIGHGRAGDATGGWETVLDLDVPAGTPLALPPPVLAALAQALRQPAGVAAVEARRQGVPHTPQREVHSHPL